MASTAAASASDAERACEVSGGVQVEAAASTLTRTAETTQHLSGVVLERVNRFFGWQAVGSLRLRQAPLGRKTRKPHPSPDPDATARMAAELTDIKDENLRDALARLGAAIKQS